MSSESTTSASPATTRDGAHAEARHAEPGHADLTHAAHGEVAHTDVPHEQPSDWGWNGEWGKWASRGGWIVVVILALMIPGVTHYNRAGFLAQGLVILGLITILIWDRARRRHAWRK